VEILGWINIICLDKVLSYEFGKISIKLDENVVYSFPWWYSYESFGTYMLLEHLEFSTFILLIFPLRNKISPKKLGKCLLN
jgi:hypothetical protein